MNNKFFPNDEDKLNFVMGVYEHEINTRKDWVLESVYRLNDAIKTNKTSSIVIYYAISIINHSMLILRLVDKEATGARTKKYEKEKAKERAEILHSRNLKFPEPPNSLREIRNDYEHFEARLDEWATKPNPNIYIDLNVGSKIVGDQIKQTDVFRHLERNKLMFWNRNIDLQEVVNWVENMSEVIIKNTEQRRGS